MCWVLFYFRISFMLGTFKWQIIFREQNGEMNDDSHVKNLKRNKRVAIVWIDSTTRWYCTINIFSNFEILSLKNTMLLITRNTALRVINCCLTPEKKKNKHTQTEERITKYQHKTNMRAKQTKYNQQTRFFFGTNVCVCVCLL